MRPRARAGQATTETVLLLPVFMLFVFIFAKIFALLILVQKVEIASFYAARRWQLESHRSADFEGFDNSALRTSINDKVLAYLGYGGPSRQINWGNGQSSEASTAGFLGLTDRCSDGSDVGFSFQRSEVWQVVTVVACTRPPFFSKLPGLVLRATKYVPNRDRPIAFVLPGLKDDNAAPTGSAGPPGGGGEGGGPP